jgi:hypothetical protein
VEHWRIRSLHARGARRVASRRCGSELREGFCGIPSKDRRTSLGPRSYESVQKTGVLAKHNWLPKGRSPCLISRTREEGRGRGRNAACCASPGQRLRGRRPSRSGGPSWRFGFRSVRVLPSESTTLGTMYPTCSCSPTAQSPGWGGSRKSPAPRTTSASSGLGSGSAFDQKARVTLSNLAAWTDPSCRVRCTDLESSCPGG